ncbi:hypothetical protein LIA77_08518 [Sarocladium implicatum]|nr:hypothetical protein LIA77_08518 [Sarocladium implicatum]
MASIPEATNIRDQGKTALGWDRQARAVRYRDSVLSLRGELGYRDDGQHPMGWQPGERDDYPTSNRDSMLSAMRYSTNVVQNYQEAAARNQSRSVTRGSTSMSPGPRGRIQPRGTSPSAVARLSKKDSFMSRPGSRQSVRSLEELPRMEAGTLLKRFKVVQDEKPELTEQQQKELDDQDQKFRRRKAQLKQQQTNLLTMLNEVKKHMFRQETGDEAEIRELTDAQASEIFDKALQIYIDLSKRVEQVYDMYTTTASRNLNAKFAEQHCTDKIGRLVQQAVSITHVENHIRLLIANAFGVDELVATENEEDQGQGQEQEQQKTEQEKEKGQAVEEDGEQEDDEDDDDNGNKQPNKLKGQKAMGPTGRPLSVDIKKQIAKHLVPEEAAAREDSALPSPFKPDVAEDSDEKVVLNQDDDGEQPEWFGGFGRGGFSDFVDPGFLRRSGIHATGGAGLRRAPTQRSNSTRSSAKDRQLKEAKTRTNRRQEQKDPNVTPSPSDKAPSSEPVATSSEGSNQGNFPGHQSAKDIRSFGDSTSDRDSVEQRQASLLGPTQGGGASVPWYTEGKTYARSQTRSEREMELEFWDSGDDDMGSNLMQRSQIDGYRIAEPTSAVSTGSSAWGPRVFPREPPQAHMAPMPLSAGSAVSLDSASSQLMIRGWLGALDEPVETQPGAELMAELEEVFGTHVDLADDIWDDDDDADFDSAEMSLPPSARAAPASGSPVWTRSYDGSVSVEKDVVQAKSRSPTKPVIPPVVEEHFSLVSFLMGQVWPWWDLIHAIWVLVIVNPFCFNAAVLLETRAVLRWYILGRESYWHAPVPSRTHLSLKSVVIILIQCFMALTVQVWVANTRERQIWQRANGETRDYLISRVYEDPSMRFLPGVDPKLMIGGPAGAAVLMGAMHFVEEWVVPKAGNSYMDCMAALLPIFFLG